MGGRRESERLPGCREGVTGTAGGRRTLVVLLGTGRSWGVCGRMGVWRAGRSCVCPRCGAGHAWTLGLVRRPVALSWLLLRWPSGSLGSCCVRRWWITETLLNAYSQGDQELNSSTGACLTGSLADAQGPAVARFSALLAVPRLFHHTLLFTKGRKVPNTTLRTIFIPTIALIVQ
jgi:hypothetical protein